MTKVGSVLAILVSVVWGLLGLFGLFIGVVLLALNDEDGSVAGFEDFFDFAGAVLAILGFIVGAAAVWCIVLAVKVIRGQGWVRVAAIITFAAFALLSFGIIASDTTTGASGTGNGNNNLEAGIANLVACVLVVLFLLFPSDSRDSA